MTPPLGRLIIYTKKLEEMTQFYTRHFGYTAHTDEADRLIELRPPNGGVVLLLHPAAKGQKEGQVLVKLVFDIPDVAAFCTQAAARGLFFSKPHKAEGYIFANCKDPAGNPVSVSSRAFAKRR